MTRAAIQELLVAEAAEGDLDSYRVVAETLGEEYDLMDVATAAIKLAHEARAGGGRSGASDDVEIPAVSVPRADHRERSKPKEKRDKRAASARSEGRAHVTRLYIGLGRSSGVRPADIVGAIAGRFDGPKASSRGYIRSSRRCVVRASHHGENSKGPALPGLFSFRTLQAPLTTPERRPKPFPPTKG